MRTEASGYLVSVESIRVPKRSELEPDYLLAKGNGKSTQRCGIMATMNELHCSKLDSPISQSGLESRNRHKLSDSCSILVLSRRASGSLSMICMGQPLLFADVQREFLMRIIKEHLTLKNPRFRW